LADGTQGAPADLAQPLGVSVRYGKDLFSLFVEKEMIGAELRP
jgi:hypothetical protein